MIFLVYQSGIIIEKQMREYMYEGAEISTGDNAALIKELSVNCSVAYTYTFAIISTLIIAGVIKLFVEYYRKYAAIKAMNSLTDLADAEVAEENIDAMLNASNIYDAKIKRLLKLKNRMRIKRIYGDEKEMSYDYK